MGGGMVFPADTHHHNIYPPHHTQTKHTKAITSPHTRNTEKTTTHTRQPKLRHSSGQICCRIGQRKRHDAWKGQRKPTRRGQCEEIKQCDEGLLVCGEKQCRGCCKWCGDLQGRGLGSIGSKPGCVKCCKFILTEILNTTVFLCKEWVCMKGGSACVFYFFM